LGMFRLAYQRDPPGGLADKLEHALQRAPAHAVFQERFRPEFGDELARFQGDLEHVAEMRFVPLTGLHTGSSGPEGWFSCGKDSAGSRGWRTRFCGDRTARRTPPASPDSPREK